MFRAMTVRMRVCSLHSDRRIIFIHGYFIPFAVPARAKAFWTMLSKAAKFVLLLTIAG